MSPISDCPTEPVKLCAKTKEGGLANFAIGPGASAWSRGKKAPVLGRLSRSDRLPALVAALRALEQADHDVRLGGVRVHGAQTHRHPGFVPVAGRGVFVRH